MAVSRAILRKIDRAVLMYVIDSMLKKVDASAGGSGASWAEHSTDDPRPANRFSCDGTFPVGPKRSVVTRTALSKRKLMLMDAMSEFDAGNRNCRIGKRLEAFH